METNKIKELIKDLEICNKNSVEVIENKEFVNDDLNETTLSYINRKTSKTQTFKVRWRSKRHLDDMIEYNIVWRPLHEKEGKPKFN